MERVISAAIMALELLDAGEDVMVVDNLSRLQPHAGPLKPKR